MSRDGAQNGLMLRDHARDPSLLRQRQPAIAIDVYLHLLDQRPNSGISGDFRNRRVKHFIRAMEGVTVFGCVCLTLTFQDRMQNQDLARRRALRGQVRGGYLKRLAHDECVRARTRRTAARSAARCAVVTSSDLRMRIASGNAAIGMRETKIPDWGNISSKPSSDNFRMASRTGVRLTP